MYLSPHSGVAMQKLNQTTEYKSANGWIIHIYDCNRRLLCSLEPSHGWSFLAGIGLGLLVSITGYNLVPPTQTAAAPNVSSEPSSAADNPSPTMELPLGID